MQSLEEHPPRTDVPRAEVPHPEVSLAAIAALHLRIGCLSFGGGMTGLIYHEVVTKRGWLREAEFLSGLTICQILPGGNVVNLAIYVGQRLRGLPGAAVAFAALLGGPFFIIIGFMLVYERLAGLPFVAAGLNGVTAAAMGLMLMMTVRGAQLSRHASSLAVIAATMIAVGVLHFPLIAVVCVAVPVSIALAARRRARHG
ncbi:chromate transporter [Starkeya koreensis]|uniref:Chromate transporter n=1 Tax=Ancylobacter koreensis TaxID=266121 RepID=A0ABT0DQA0_9HYPH|nr:chromate transporter [Ancylobacter koreensis]MCK0209452.1 chromate transporter [Ancylobacter koreensis]